MGAFLCNVCGKMCFFLCSKLMHYNMKGAFFFIMTFSCTSLCCKGLNVRQQTLRSIQRCSRYICGLVLFQLSDWVKTRKWGWWGGTFGLVPCFPEDRYNCAIDLATLFFPSMSVHLQTFVMYFVIGNGSVGSHSCQHLLNCFSFEGSPLALLC